MAVTHGGNLNAAIARFGGRREDWVDLSTGVSPWSWPVPALPEAVWQRLPEEDDSLVDSAAAYYGCDAGELLPLPGSQHAIRLLPALWPRGTVALPAWGYEEHRAAWAGAGHHCRFYRDRAELEAQVADPALRYAVVINPNNPLGTVEEPGVLLALAARLAQRGGRLLVDEAFVDGHPGHSLVPRRPPAVVVLRSAGKFFGLAGLRLGFALAEAADLAALQGATNPWSVSHPARWVGAAALADTRWQEGQRRRIERESGHWQQAVRALLPGWEVRNGGLFASVTLPAEAAAALQEAAAAQRLWLRVYGPRGGQSVLRLGLPPPARSPEVAARLRRAAGACHRSITVDSGQ